VIEAQSMHMEDRMDDRKNVVEGRLGAQVHRYFAGNELALLTKVYAGIHIRAEGSLDEVSGGRTETTCRRRNAKLCGML
jgi:hypothetical protein